MTLEQARAHFYRDKYAVELTGVVIDEVGHRCAKCHLDIDERHYAAHHHVMGGVVYTLADFAFAVAANHEGNFTVTVSSNIIYMDQPRDNRLNANCYCIKAGRKMSYFEVEITDGGGRPVASVTVTGMHLSGEKL